MTNEMKKIKLKDFKPPEELGITLSVSQKGKKHDFHYQGFRFTFNTELQYYDSYRCYPHTNKCNAKLHVGILNGKYVVRIPNNRGEKQFKHTGNCPGAKQQKQERNCLNDQGKQEFHKIQNMNNIEQNNFSVKSISQQFAEVDPSGMRLMRNHEPLPDFPVSMEEFGMDFPVDDLDVLLEDENSVLLTEDICNVPKKGFENPQINTFKVSELVRSQVFQENVQKIHANKFQGFNMNYSRGSKNSIHPSKEFRVGVGDLRSPFGTNYGSKAREKRFVKQIPNRTWNANIYRNQINVNRNYHNKGINTMNRNTNFGNNNFNLDFCNNMGFINL